MNPQMENNLPLWLQKEIEQFGVFEPDAQVIHYRDRYTREDTLVAWKPSYLNEEPPF